MYPKNERGQVQNAKLDETAADPRAEFCEKDGLSGLTVRCAFQSRNPLTSACLAQQKWFSVRDAVDKVARRRVAFLVGRSVGRSVVS